MTRIRILAVALAVATLALTACAAVAPDPARTTSGPSTGSAAQTRDIVYREVDDRELRLDACLPDDPGPHPAVVLVHGGAFLEGDRTSMRAACETFASIGVAAFSVDYRLLPATYPAPVEDVTAAVRWIRSPAQTQRFALDGTVAIFGTSAGAIISLSAAAALDQEGAPVQALVALSGAGDLRPETAQLGEPGNALERVALAYLGCERGDACAAASAASPITVAAHLPPTLLVHGSRELIPVSQAEGLAAALDASGVPHELIVVDGDAHGVDLLAGDIPGRIADFLGRVYAEPAAS